MPLMVPLTRKNTVYLEMRYTAIHELSIKVSLEDLTGNRKGRDGNWEKQRSNCVYTEQMKQSKDESKGVHDMSQYRDTSR